MRLFGTRREAILILAIAALGTLAESALGLTGWLSYRSHAGPSWPCPPWILAMWANFGMTLRHSLRWLEGKGGGAVLFADVTLQEASEYIEVPGGVYDLEVRPAGSQEVALSIPGVEVLAKTTYTVFAIGRSFNGTLAALPVVDAP